MQNVNQPFLLPFFCENATPPAEPTENTLAIEKDHTQYVSFHSLRYTPTCNLSACFIVR